MVSIRWHLGCLEGYLGGCWYEGMLSQSQSKLVQLASIDSVLHVLCTPIGLMPDIDSLQKGGWQKQRHAA